MELVIQNVTVLTLDEGQPVLENAWIGIDNGKITALDITPPPQAKRVIEGRGKLVMPGLVNAHTHVSMSILRGYADDYTLQAWLEKHIWPAEAKMDAPAMAVGAQLGFAEMIAGGTVSVTDMYSHIPDIAQVAFDAGIYANLGNGALCFDRENYRFEDNNSTKEMRTMLECWHGADDGRILLDASIHAEYTSFPALWRDYATFAAEHNLRMHVHVSETELEHRACIARYGKTPAAALMEAGVFDTPALAAHCVWAEEPDIEIFRQKGVTVAHNPVSNLKLASGVAPIPQMLEAGVNVALGTDSVASNNSHDLFEEIKMAAILHKGVRQNPHAIPAMEALRMATVNGAQSQGRAGRLGRIAPGYDASLIMLDLDKPHLTPMHNPMSHAVYAARGSDVCLTMVRGKILYENGEHKTIDMEKVRYELKHTVMPQVFGA